MGMRPDFVTPDGRPVIPQEPRLHKLVIDVLYEAPNDAEADRLANAITAATLDFDAVWEAEGNYYFEESSDPLNKQVISRGR